MCQSVCLAFSFQKYTIGLGCVVSNHWDMSSGLHAWPPLTSKDKSHSWHSVNVYSLVSEEQGSKRATKCAFKEWKNPTTRALVWVNVIRSRELHGRRGSQSTNDSRMPCNQWFSAGSVVAPVEPLTVSGDILLLPQQRGCYWLLIGRAQGAAKHPTIHRTTSMAKNHWPQSVNSAEVERLSCRAQRECAS